jgi:hypothetical protein
LVLINNTTIAFDGENECTASDHLELVKVASAQLQALSLQCQLSGRMADVHRPSPISDRILLGTQGPDCILTPRLHTPWGGFLKNPLVRWTLFGKSVQQTL